MNQSDGLGGYYGKKFVLTDDAYLYRIDANGNHGLGFAFFANNTGYIDQFGNPLYKSVSDFRQENHYPYLPDTDKYITHKIFYNIPDLDLPETASGRFPGNTTWLLHEAIAHKVENIKITGVEGGLGKVSKKGAWIEYKASYEGRYLIEIVSQSSSHPFAMRKIVHNTAIGDNKIYWDGLDGEGNFLPYGKDYPIQVRISFMGGEVHFPYLDMEVNPNGILVDRFSLSGDSLGYVKLYWNDIDINPKIADQQSKPLVNLDGILSSLNGHKWGNFNKGVEFADNKGMDTWTYNVDESFSEQIKLTVDIHDLKILAVSSDKSEVLYGEKYEYTVVIRNDGPSDGEDVLFNFDVPEGVVIDSYRQLVGSCGDYRPNTSSPHQSTVYLDIPSGCELVFVFKVSVETIKEEYFSKIPVKASVVRASDTTDPDATSDDVDLTSPGTPEKECGSGICNNIMEHDKVILIDPAEAGAKIGLIKKVTFEDVNGDDAVSEGDHLIYDFEILNRGDVYLKNLVLLDKKFSDAPIWSSHELLPYEQIHFQYVYTLTRQDLSAPVYNSAVINSYTNRGRLISDISGSAFDNDDITVFSSEGLPGLYLKKSVTNTGTGENGQFTIGDVIEYRFDIKHTGDTYISDVKLLDDFISDSEITVDNLAFNGITTVYASYIIDEDDIINGKVINSAVIIGKEDKFKVTIKDVSGLTFEDDNPTITEVSRPYVTYDDDIHVFQGEESIKINIVENDLRGSSTIDYIVLMNEPNFGTFIKKEDQTYYYVPKDGVKDVEENISYVILDKSGLQSNKSVIRIYVHATKAIAVNDLVNSYYSVKKKIYPLKNDYSEGSTINPQSLTIVSQPNNGTLYLDDEGNVNYHPDPYFTGIDVFEYQISDMNGNPSNIAKVEIDVRGYFIPNVITPNNDGINDSFYIIGANYYDRIELTVFDRFGTVIYDNKNYNNDWTPSDAITDGTYFYVLKFYKDSGEKLYKKGYLLIVRNIRI